MKQVTTCVIPAAGLGTRWAPISNYYPKEMILFGDKLVIQEIIEELIKNGFKRVVIVISEDKPLLKRFLREEPDINSQIEVEFVYQNEPLGLAHAILQTEQIISDEYFAVIFPDMPSTKNSQILNQLEDELSKVSNLLALLAVARYPDNNQLAYSRCLGEVNSAGLLEIEGFSNDPVEGGLTIAGRYFLSKRIFPIIREKLENSDNSSEVNDTAIFQAGINKGEKVWAKEVDQFIFDTGTPANYLQAMAKLAQLR